MATSGKRLLLPALALLAGLGLTGAGWLIAHHVPWHARAQRLWSEEDLPRLPDPRENGWVVANATAARLPKEIVPPDLRSVLRSPDWARTKALAARLRRFGEDPEVRALDAIALTSLQAPRFVDGCPIAVDAGCHPVEVTQLLEVAALGTLGAARDGRWGEALARARALLRADGDLMSTSRSALAALAARRSLRRDLDLVALLLGGLEEKGPRGLDAHRAAIAAIAALLEPPPQPDPDGWRAVVSEYVYVTKVVRDLSSGVRQRGAAAGVSPILLDEEQTVALANRYFEALARFARRPSAAPPAFPRYSRDGFGWWAYNPAGKLMLDAAMLDQAPAIRRMADQKAALAASRDGLRQRIRALLSDGRSGVLTVR
jgi:hypothetical protein